MKDNQIKVFVDMDDVLCDYAKGYEQSLESHPNVKWKQSIPGFFENLEPIDGAIESYHKLSSMFDVRILTAPSVWNPACYMEKRLWVEKHLGFNACYGLNLCYDKSIVKGEFLIDDKMDTNGQNEFEGTLILFGSDRFPNWDKVMDFLILFK